MAAHVAALKRAFDDWKSESSAGLSQATAIVNMLLDSSYVRCGSFAAKPRKITVFPRFMTPSYLGPCLQACHMGFVKEISRKCAELRAGLSRLVSWVAACWRIHLTWLTFAG
jgi:hypothetical protein